MIDRRGPLLVCLSANVSKWGERGKMCPLFHGNNLFFRLLSSEVRNSEFQGSFRFLSFFLFVFVVVCLYVFFVVGG